MTHPVSTEPRSACGRWWQRAIEWSQRAAARHPGAWWGGMHLLTMTPEALIAAAGAGWASAGATLKTLGAAAAGSLQLSDAAAAAAAQERDQHIKQWYAAWPPLRTVGARLRVDRCRESLRYDVLAHCVARLEELEAHSLTPLQNRARDMAGVVMQVWATCLCFDDWSDTDRLMVLRPAIEHSDELGQPTLDYAIENLANAMARLGCPPADQAKVIARTLQKHPGLAAYTLNTLFQILQTHWFALQPQAGAVTQLLLVLLTISEPEGIHPYEQHFRTALKVVHPPATATPGERAQGFAMFSQLLHCLAALPPAQHGPFLQALAPATSWPFAWRVATLALLVQLAQQTPQSVMPSITPLLFFLNTEHSKPASKRTVNLANPADVTTFTADVLKLCRTESRFSGFRFDVLRTAYGARLRQAVADARAIREQVVHRQRLAPPALRFALWEQWAMFGDGLPLSDSLEDAVYAASAAPTPSWPSLGLGPIAPRSVRVPRPPAGVTDPDFVMRDTVRTVRTGAHLSADTAWASLRDAVDQYQRAPSTDRADAVWQAVLAASWHHPDVVGRRENISAPARPDSTANHALRIALQEIIQEFTREDIRAAPGAARATAAGHQRRVASDALALLDAAVLHRRLARIPSAWLHQCASLRDDRDFLHTLQDALATTGPELPRPSTHHRTARREHHERLLVLERTALYEHLWTLADVPELRRVVAEFLPSAPPVRAPHVAAPALSRSAAPSLEALLTERVQRLHEIAADGSAYASFPVQGGHFLHAHGRMGLIWFRHFLGMEDRPLQELVALWEHPNAVPILLFDPNDLVIGHLFGWRTTINGQPALLLARGGLRPEAREGICDLPAYGRALADALYHALDRTPVSSLYLGAQVATAELTSFPHGLPFLPRTQTYRPLTKPVTIHPEHSAETLAYFVPR